MLYVSTMFMAPLLGTMFFPRGSCRWSTLDVVAYWWFLLCAGSDSTSGGRGSNWGPQAPG